MNLRALFVTGCVLALTGFALSLTRQPVATDAGALLNVAGALLNVLAILCAVGIIYLRRVHRDAALLPPSRPFLWITSGALILAVAANVSSFGRPAWHGYAQALMMFILAIQSLLNGASFPDSPAT